MPGLVPGIHVLRHRGVGPVRTSRWRDVDARDKPGHDDIEGRGQAGNLYRTAVDSLRASTSCGIVVWAGSGRAGGGTWMAGRPPDQVRGRPRRIVTTPAARPPFTSFPRKRESRVVQHPVRCPFWTPAFAGVTGVSGRPRGGVHIDRHPRRHPSYRHARTRSGHPRLAASRCGPGADEPVEGRGYPEQVRARRCGRSGTGRKSDQPPGSRDPRCFARTSFTGKTCGGGRPVPVTPAQAGVQDLPRTRSGARDPMGGASLDSPISRKRRAGGALRPLRLPIDRRHAGKSCSAGGAAAGP